MPPEPVPLDYYSVFTQKFYLVSSYTLTARSVQTEIHNLHGKCICCCGYLDKHTRLNFYLYEPQKPNIYQGIIVRSGVDSVALFGTVRNLCILLMWSVQQGGVCSFAIPKISPWQNIELLCAVFILSSCLVCFMISRHHQASHLWMSRCFLLGNVKCEGNWNVNFHSDS